MVEPNKAVFNKLAAKKQLERDQQLRSIVDDTIIPYFTRAIVRDVDTVGGQLDGINPINSIVADIVELISDGEAPIFYPMFSSHMMLPIKENEEVWVMFENISNMTLGYWISRTPELIRTDDINKANSLTKHKFDFFLDNTISNSEDVTATDIELDESIRTGVDSQDRTSDRFDENKTGLNSRFIKDLVPIYRKESTGDFVIQGSNNASIILTTNRKEQGEETDRQKAGSIDIVVGRGNNAEAKPNELDGIRNGEEEKETEGIISYNSDSARILVTMNSNADTNFQTTQQGAINDNAKSFIVQKSDAIRLVARSSIKIETQPINDDGAIIDDDRASLVIKPDGEIIIHAKNGKKIKIGSQNAENEPAVLGQTLKNILEDFIVKLGTIHSIATGAGPSGPIGGAPNFVTVTDAWKATLVNMLSDKTFLDDKSA